MYVLYPEAIHLSSNGFNAVSKRHMHLVYYRRHMHAHMQP